MIDTAALQSKIIDLAIQGKLTEQLPTDGNAEDLYQQIQAEKAQLIKEKKIKKEKPLPELSANEIPFEIPENWKWVRLGDVTFIERGGSPRPIKQYLTDSADGINWIKIGDVEKGGKYIFDTKEKIIAEGKKKSRRVYPGDFLLTNSMSFGRPYISKIEGCIHDGWLVIRDLKGYSPEYLYYLLSSSNLYNQFCNKASGSTVNNLNIDKVNNSVVTLPPLSEQERIVAKLDEVLTEIKIIDELQTQYASNVDALKSKIIDAGIRGQLTEQLPEDGTAEELYQAIQTEKAQLIKDKKIKKEKPLPEITADEIPFEIPDNWKWVRWGDISQSIQYGYNAPALENGRIKMVRISDIQSNEVLWEDVPYCDIDEDSIETYLLQPNDILFARTGGTVGKSYLVEEVPEEAVYAGYLIRTRYSSLLSPRYLKYFMQGSLYWSQLRNGTIATAQPNCNGKTLGKMIVPLPPLSEQKRIVAKINDVFGALDERDRL